MMTWQSTVLGVPALTMLLAVTPPAAAHPSSQDAVGPAGQVGDLTRLRPGTAVWVTTIDRRAHAGTLVTASSEAVEIAAHGTVVRLPLPDVWSVDVRDPVGNGARIGALAGGISSAGWAVLLAYGMRCESNCGDYSLARDIATTAAVFGAIGAGVGAATGALIDRMHGRRRVYGAVGGPRPEVAILPRVGPAGTGVHVILRW